MKHRLLPLILLASAAFGADFSGTWKLDTAKSDFGPIPAPESMTRVVTQTADTFTFETTQKNDQGEVKTKLTYKLDGSPTTNKTALGEVKGFATREGEKIRIKSTRDAGGMEISFDELWTLASDGKSINILNKVGTAQGDLEIKMLLVK